MNFFVIVGVIAVLVALNFARLNILAWLAAWWVGMYVMFAYGVNPPLPSSIVIMFMAIVTLALFAYMSANSDYLKNVKDKSVAFMTERKYLVPLAIVLIALPSLVAFRVYSNATQAPQSPANTRTIHPPPPTSITFNGKNMDLVTLENPYRPLKESDPAAFQAHSDNGRRIYYENCVYCHGDDMAGDGIFAHGYDPIPANFQNPTTIAMLQESYLFWRIAKGAPGLPEESTPWASAMPAWELFLNEEEIWDVIIFLYEYTGYEPRENEEIH